MRDYNLYLTFEADLDLDINDDSGSLCEYMFAQIMHETDEAVQNAEYDEPERTGIGFVHMMYYNQALAMDYGLRMTDFPELARANLARPVMELDYNLIGEETIKAIGAASNPNIMMLLHFGIASHWRSKGIGEQALKGIVKQSKGKCGYIIIKSEPAQHGRYTGPDSLYEKQKVKLVGLERDPEKAQMKLNAFFQRCGFKPFKDYKNIFVCNVDQFIPDRMMTKR